MTHCALCTQVIGCRSGWITLIIQISIVSSFARRHFEHNIPPIKHWVSILFTCMFTVALNKSVTVRYVMYLQEPNPNMAHDTDKFFEICGRPSRKCFQRETKKNLEGDRTNF